MLVTAFFMAKRMKESKTLRCLFKIHESGISLASQGIQVLVGTLQEIKGAKGHLKMDKIKDVISRASIKGIKCDNIEISHNDSSEIESSKNLQVKCNKVDIDAQSYLDRRKQMSK